MNLSDIARKIMEADDDKYVSIGYGRYKLKGKEDDDNADVFTKTDSGQYVKSADQKSDDDKGGEEKPSGGGMGAGDFERDFDDSDDEPKGKKDAQGREYDPMTGKGKGLDYRGEPDDEEWFKSMMGGGEPEDKDESISINGKKYRPIKESILNENPAAMAAAAMATVKVKNAQGKQIKGTSALQSSDPSVQKKAKSIFQRLKDKFSKKKGKKDFEKQKKKVAKGADAWVKNQSKSDADFYKRQFAGESIIVNGKQYHSIKESDQRIFKENYDKIFRSLK